MENNLGKIRILDIIEFYLFSVLFLLIPFKVKLVTVIFIFIILNFIIRLIITNQKINFSFTKFREYYGKLSWVLIGMFFFEIIHIFGMLYSKNQSFGWFDIQVKLMFILIPFYLFVNPLKYNNWIIYAFFIGCSIIVIIDTSLYFFPERFNVKYEDLYIYSKYMHRTYLGMYLLIASSILFFYSKIPNFIQFILFPVFSIGIILSLSKAAVISYVLLCCLIFIYLFIKKKWFHVSFILILLFLIYIAPLKEEKKQLNNRFSSLTINNKEKIENKTSIESSTARKFTWHASSEVIKTNPIFGVGTGDIKDELYKKQIELGYYGIANQHLNSHNQYLNTWIAIGIPGLLALISFTLVGLLISIKLKNWLMFSFFSIFCFNALFESIFETEAGIYAFCFCLILNNKEKNKRLE